MEIMPNSTIHFLRNIPFDNEYNDTYYFDSPSEQEDFFTSAENNFIKYTIDDQYYIRHSANVIDVEIPNLGTTIDSTTGKLVKLTSAESLFDCNYMMFRNENFGSFVRTGVGDDGYLRKKWFYAFITDVEYVNNEVARVTFEIDVMQTWMFDYELEQCFIEREHSETDGIGDNIVPENLDIGDSYLTTESYDVIAKTEHIKAYILVARKYEGERYVYPIIYLLNNIPTTLWVASFNIETELDDMWNFLTPYILETDNKLTPDDIVAIYLFPDENFYGHYNNYGLARPTNFYYTTSEKGDVIYTPKNKKLFTYPYIGVEVSNHEGTAQMYRYEYFVQRDDIIPMGGGAGGRKSNAYFRIDGASSPSPALIAYPINYLPSQSWNNSEQSLLQYTNDGYDYGVVISDFQQCAWVGDTFKAWWAQNKNSWSASAFSSAIAGGATLLAGAVLENPYLVGTGLSNVIGGVWSSLAKKEDIENRSPSINGLTNSLSLPIALDYFGYTFRVKQISAQYAEIIDDYFSMFGYASHRVKKPNRHVREKWTYTQTKGCEIHGKLPSKYQTEICKIYDNGIRFWDKNAKVGEYRNSEGELYDNECLT